MVFSVGATPQKHLSFILQHHVILHGLSQNPQVKFLMIFANCGAPKTLFFGVGALKLLILRSLWKLAATTPLWQEYAG